MRKSCREQCKTMNVGIPGGRQHGYASCSIKQHPATACLSVTIQATERQTIIDTRDRSDRACRHLLMLSSHPLARSMSFHASPHKRRWQGRCIVACPYYGINKHVGTPCALTAPVLTRPALACLDTYLAVTAHVFPLPLPWQLRKGSASGLISRVLAGKVGDKILGRSTHRFTMGSPTTKFVTAERAQHDSTNGSFWAGHAVYRRLWTVSSSNEFAGLITALDLHCAYATRPHP
jgi:hypothetical protein